MSAENLGFIGLGNIGYPIAAHLLKTQKPVYGFDVQPSTMEALAKEGGVIAQSVADLATHCQYIGICVRDDNDVNKLLYGEDGILSHASEGTHIAIHSTVTQKGLEKWHKDGAEKGITIIDAPISGGADGAKKAELCYMVGGDQTTVEKLSPYFETSGEKIIHAGELGTGMALKLCNNLITYFEFTAMSEATRLAESCGLSANVLREVGKSNGIINEKMYTMINSRNNLLDGGCTPEQMDQFMGSFARLGRKDLECALETAGSNDIDLPATELIKNMIEGVFVER